MAQLLSKGVLAKIALGEEIPLPVLQIVKVAVYQAANTRVRSLPRRPGLFPCTFFPFPRLLLSDGERCMQGTATTAITAQFTNGTYGMGSVVRLDEYICNETNGKK